MARARGAKPRCLPHSADRPDGQLPAGLHITLDHRLQVGARVSCDRCRAGRGIAGLGRPDAAAYRRPHAAGMVSGDQPGQRRRPAMRRAARFDLSAAQLAVVPRLFLRADALGAAHHLRDPHRLRGIRRLQPRSVRCRRFLWPGGAAAAGNPRQIGDFETRCALSADCSARRGGSILQDRPDATGPVGGRASAEQGRHHHGSEWIRLGPDQMEHDARHPAPSRPHGELVSERLCAWAEPDRPNKRCHSHRRRVHLPRVPWSPRGATRQRSGPLRPATSFSSSTMR